VTFAVFFNLLPSCRSAFIRLASARMQASPTASQTKHGILLMLGAVVCFTAMDAVAKSLIATYPTAMVIWARYVVMLGFVVVLLRGRMRSFLKTDHLGLHIIRSILQFATVYLFFLSLSYIGLAEAQALTDINPVLITLGAALFLGERLGVHRIGAIVVALLGALIVIRPGFGVFSLAALLPLAAAVTYAAAALITRKVGAVESPWTAMIYASCIGSVMATVPLPLVWIPVAAADLWQFVLLGALGTGAQLLIIRSFSVAEASAVAPFAYSGLIMAVFWGIVLFGEYPDLPTVIGALVIVAAGLYVWHRETRTAHQG
jgi:drug/metabolite transporter (DMT)-like permease